MEGDKREKDGVKKSEGEQTEGEKGQPMGE